MTSQKHDFYDPNAMQNEYLEKLGMRYPQDEDCEPINKNTTDKCKKTKIRKMDKQQRGLKFLERNVQRVKTKLQNYNMMLL